MCCRAERCLINTIELNYGDSFDALAREDDDHDDTAEAFKEPTSNVKTRETTQSTAPQGSPLSLSLSLSPLKGLQPPRRLSTREKLIMPISLMSSKPMVTGLQSGSLLVVAAQST